MPEVWVILTYTSSQTNTKPCGFSVIIAARNEAENLKKLIPRLLEQNYPDFEIIIALDRCSDNSTQVLKPFLDQSAKLKVIEIQEKPVDFDGKKNALTKAIALSTKDWLLLTDADCLPSTHRWIAAFNKQIEPDTKILLGFGPMKYEPGLLNAFIRHETFQTAFQYCSATLRGKPYMGVGRNLAYKKSLFNKVGGFQDYKNLTGGDDDLFVQKHANSNNTKVVLSKESLTYSAPKRTFKEYLTQKTRHLSVGKYYRSKLKNVLTFKAVIHLVVWLSFLYLAFSNPSDLFAIGFFGSLMVLKGFVFTKTASKTGTHFSLLWFPIADFLYAVILPLIGIRAVFVKSIRWK